MNSISAYLKLTSMLLVASLAACDGGASDPEPPPGGGGCTPRTTTGCSAGEVCSSAGVCIPENTTAGNLVIESASARACEVLLSSNSAKVVRATYGSGVAGALRARPPRYAIAVSHQGTGGFAPDAVNLAIEGDPTVVSVVSVNCYGADGQATTGATARLQ